MTRRIDAISNSRFHSSMIDEECGDSRETIIVYFALLYFFRIDFDAFAWERIGCGLTNTDITTKCLNKVLHHAASSWRAPYWKGFISAQKPSRKPQIRDSDNMVGVKMSEKETVYLFRANSSPPQDGFAVANLGQANYNTAATVKQQLLAGHFDKNG